MAKNRGKILIVDDNEDVLLSLNLLLKHKVEAVRVTTNPERIGKFMDSFDPDVILLDMNFHSYAVSGEEGYKWLDFILKKNPQAVVLFITAYVDTEKAVRAIKAGAVDFIPKPWDKSKLLGILESAVELSLSRRFPPEYQSDEKSPLMIGESPEMIRVKQQAAKIAATDANVFITGENGTGKDVLAHLIHHLSRRKDMPFVTIDLGAIPEQLFESELFGYEKGAFTDARAAKAGRIESADSGTIFLDEIGNLSLQSQQKLLTLIEKRELSRLGSTKIKGIDVRLITASNASLEQMVSDGRFRQDLLYRINTIEIHLPPLRERGEDIGLLTNHFANEIAARYKIKVPTITREALQKIRQHHWHGNVRELQHVIERAIVLASGNVVDAEDISFAKPIPSTKSETLNLEALERETIQKAIDRANGNLSQAAELLGISRFSLYRKIEKFGI